MAALLGWVADRCQAADYRETFVGILAVAVDEPGARRLGLTDEVKARLQDLIDRRVKEATNLAMQIKDLPPAERERRLAPFVKQSEQLGMELLTVQQRAILQQMRIARAGMSSLADADVAKVLGLSEEQQANVRKVLERRDQETAQGSVEQRRIARERAERELAALLTKQQLANWEALAGLGGAAAEESAPAPPPAPSAAAAAAPPQPPAGGGTPAVPAAPRPEPGPAGVAATPPKPEPPAPAPAPPKPEAPPVAAAPAVPSPPPAAQPAPPPPGKPDVAAEGMPDPDTVRVRFNFHHQPWKDVLEWLADQAGLSLNMEIPPPGSFNYRDTRTYTLSKAIDLINAALLTKGYTLIRKERMLIVLNREDPIPPELVEFVPLTELDKRGDFEYVKCLFPLAKMEPAEAAAEISQLIGIAPAAVVPLPKSMQLLVTETGARLRMIRSVIEAIENPTAVHAQAIVDVTLKHLSAEQFLALARPLLGLLPEQNSGQDIQISVHPTEPRLLATGSNKQTLQRFQDLVQLLDREGDPVEEEQPQIETYAIVNADPTTVLQVMQTLMAGRPGVRLALDPLTNKLVAMARPSEHATIQVTLNQLEGEVELTDVIELRRFDPQAMLLTINKMFPADASGKGVKVDGDPASRRLWVRGTRAQIEQIRELVQQLEGQEPAFGSLADRIRMLPFSGPQAQSAIKQAEQLWSTWRPDVPIRVVNPSAFSSALRQQTTRSLQGPLGKPPAVAPSAPPPESPGPEKPKPPEKPQPLEKKLPPRDDAARGKLRAVWASYEESPAAENAASAPAAAAGAESAPQAKESPSDLAVGQKAAEKEAAPAQGIVVSMSPSGVMVAGPEREVLDEFEKLLRSTLEFSAQAGAEPVVYYLKYAKADTVAELLQQVLTGQPVSSGGSLLGDVASSVVGGIGGGIIGSMLGGSGGSSTYAGSTSIIPDVRLNALIVQGSPSDISLIERLLPIIDQPESPEPVETAGKPRRIDVKYMPASEVAEVVRAVFADRMGGADARRQGPPNPEELIRAMRGMRGGSRSQQDVQRMTMAVDQRSNSLIVCAPDPLFKEVEELVRQLDEENKDTDEIMRTVTITNANPQTLRNALSAIMGDSVRTGSTSSSRTGSRTASPGQPPGGGPGFDFMRMMQMGRGGGGSPLGGAFSRGSSGFQGGVQGGGMPSGGGFQGGGMPSRGGFQGGGMPSRGGFQRGGMPSGRSSFQVRGGMPSGRTTPQGSPGRPSGGGRGR